MLMFFNILVEDTFLVMLKVIHFCIAVSTLSTVEASKTVDTI